MAPDLLIASELRIKTDAEDLNDGSCHLVKDSNTFSPLSNKESEVSALQTLMEKLTEIRRKSMASGTEQFDGLTSIILWIGKKKKMNSVDQ